MPSGTAVADKAGPEPSVLQRYRSRSDVVARRVGAAGRRVGGAATWAGTGLIAAGLLIGVLIMWFGPLRTGELGLDQTLARHRDLAMTTLTESLDILVGPVGGVVLLGGLCALIWLRDRIAAVQLAVLTIGGWWSVAAVKLLFHRARPQASGVRALLLETGHDGFPSGHTALVSAAVAAGCVLLWSRGRRTGPLLAAGGLMILVVALSRLYLGVHFAGDVIAAPLIAGGAVLLLARLMGAMTDAAVARAPLT